LRALLAVCDRSRVTLHSRRSLMFVVVLLAACGGGDRDAEGREAEPIAVLPPERVPVPGPPSPYDEEGELRESDDHVSGLVLPVSLEPLVTEDRRHVYTTSVPMTKVLRYFGPRLVTGRVDPRAGGGASYRDALPQGATGSYIHVDVTITPIPGPATRVEIEELLPPPTTPPTEQEAMEDLARRIREAE
jgi:hypothetical protein